MNLVREYTLIFADWRERSTLRTRYTTDLENMFLRRGRPASNASQPLYNHSDSLASSFTATAQSTRRRKSVRVAEYQNATPRLTRPDAQASTKQTGEGSKSPKNNNVIQGLCSTVQIQIDDQRPANFQYREEHFLHKGDEDEEAEDGEWSGKDQIEVPSHYAW